MRGINAYPPVSLDRPDDSCVNCEQAFHPHILPLFVRDTTNPSLLPPLILDKCVTNFVAQCDILHVARKKNIILYPVGVRAEMYSDVHSDRVTVLDQTHPAHLLESIQGVLDWLYPRSALPSSELALKIALSTVAAGLLAKYGYSRFVRSRQFQKEMAKTQSTYLHRRKKLSTSQKKRLRAAETQFVRHPTVSTLRKVQHHLNTPRN